MPVTSQPIKASLALVVNQRDEMGNSMIKRRSYNNVRTNASEESVYNAAAAIASLSDDTLLEVESVKVNSLTSY